MTEIDKSVKLVFHEFQRSIAEVPLDVYYQTISAEQFSSNGYQFNIKQPGSNALLDVDVWVEFNIKIRDLTNNYIRNCFITAADNSRVPATSNKFALRGGNPIARSTQNLSVMINNQTLNVQPYRYMDVLNRLYISNDQSEHEFSASGGRFDEGDHSWWTDHVTYGNTYGGSTMAAAPLINSPIEIYAQDWYQADPARSVNIAIYSVLRSQYPVRYPFYNPGFSSRFDKMASKLRYDWSLGGGSTANSATATQFISTPSPDAAQQYIWELKLYERLPIPLFKMYSTDGQYGVIPNVTQMQIQGNFMNNMLATMFFSDDDDFAGNVALYWDDTALSDCKLYLRWYTAPSSMAIPREISVPYHKLSLWSKAETFTAMSAVQANFETTDTFQEYNITLEAIPDLLCIFWKYRMTSYTADTPDDYNLEIIELILNIDNSSGKVNQIQTIDLYQKWKKLIKHQDPKIIGFDEWRKYCCVAMLQPEDYGVRYGPGYSNQTTLGVKARCTNWHNIPSIGYRANVPLGGDTGAGTAGEMVVLQIYNKNRLVIRSDGTCQQELTKVAADFNMMGPIGSQPSQLTGRIL